jgi:hypothetical protein
MSEIKDYQDLIIWQKAIEIAEKCYYLTKKYPQDELYGLVQQIRRKDIINLLKQETRMIAALIKKLEP